MNITSTIGKIPPMNAAAVTFFVFAKVFGMVGVGLGFLGGGYLFVGGCCLSAAFISIFLSISCSLIQTVKDRKMFEKEDSEASAHRNAILQKQSIEEEIRELELKKKSLENFISRRM